MSKRETVLVTGATGFVGGAVTRALLGRGYQVRVLARSQDRARELVSLGASPVIADMREPATYRDAAASVGAVVHAAQLRTSGRITLRKLARLAQANDTMTQTLAGACQSGGARLIYTAGAFTYGDHQDRWITERTPFDPSPLGVAHAAGVRMLRSLRGQGLDYVVLNLGFVYGPGGNFKAAFYDQATRGMLRCIGPGTNFWSLVHVDDAAAGYLAALEYGASGEEYNLADDAPLRLRALVDEITRVMGKRHVGTIPARLAALAVGGPAIASLTTSYRVSAARAHTELGWKPAYPSVADGLPPAIAALAGRPADRPLPLARS